MIDALTFVALALIGLIAAETWAFVARHSKTKWWETREGRYLMKSKTALALTFTMTLVFQAVQPKVETRLIISVLLFAWIAYAFAELLVLQSLAKRENKRRASENS